MVQFAILKFYLPNRVMYFLTGEFSHIVLINKIRKAQSKHKLPHSPKIIYNKDRFSLNIETKFYKLLLHLIKHKKLGPESCLHQITYSL